MCVSIGSIVGYLLHEEGSSNLSQMVWYELHDKAYSNQLLNYSPPLQNPLSRNSINEVVLDIVHHAP